MISASGGEVKIAVKYRVERKRGTHSRPPDVAVCANATPAHRAVGHGVCPADGGAGDARGASAPRLGTILLPRRYQAATWRRFRAAGPPKGLRLGRDQRDQSFASVPVGTGDVPLLRYPTAAAFSLRL
jgi:hypothetical protein